MTREEAIKRIREHMIIHAEKEPRAIYITEALNMAIKALEQEPCEDATNRWIPVSERLPEEGQRVLVTSYGRVCYAMMTSKDGNSGYPIFRLQDSLKEKVVCETTVHNEFTTSRITAWMPLPEPWEGEVQE